MNPQSVLQQHYPLSSKKFWKRIIEKIIMFGLLSLFIGGFIGVMMVILNTDSSNGDILFPLLAYGVVSFIFVFFVGMGLYSWYISVYIKRYYYAGEEHFITIKKGVFAPAEIHVQWQKIQDVYVDQDILDRILGLFDVHIASATASSGMEAHIDGVDQISADGLKKFLLDKVSGAGKNMMQSNVDAQSLGAVPSIQPKSQPQSISLSEEISSDVYPLSEKWILVALLSRLFGSFSFATILFIYSAATFDYFPLENNLIYYLFGWLIICLLTMIYRTIVLLLWRKNYGFKFMPDHIYYKEGVISLSEKHMPYSSIQDVTVRQGVLDRLFGLAKVIIENAAQGQMVFGQSGQRIGGFNGIQLQGLSLADANKITDLLKTSVLGKNTSQYGL